ncbi:MAG TPA: AsmA-like C-terminal region-containing protein [Candidatus Acidoferrum sp.]|nr:AsmA-like C-terminal region-containing protein [Candidatus Acidoferrum sp.]
MKWIVIALAAGVVLVIAATALLPRVVDTPRVQSLIASSASQALARPVRFRSASVAAWPYPAVRLRDVEIAEDPAFGGDPFVRLDHAEVRLKLWPLLRGRFEFTTVMLRRPIMTLTHGPGGRWNFASLGGPREAAAVPRAPRIGGGAAVPAGLATRVVIEKGTVVYERRGTAGVTLRQRLEDVDASLSPSAGGLAFSGAARVVPGGLWVKISDGTIGLAGARTLAEASLRGRMAIDGEDVRPLAASVLGDEPAMGGALTGRLDLSGSLGRPRAVGELEWRDATVTRTSAACAEPRRRTLRLATVKASVSWRDGRLVAEPLTSGIARGTAKTRLVATTSAPTRAELSELAIERIPLEPVVVDFLCLDYAVVGLFDLTGTLTLAPADPLRTLSGRGRVHVGAGRVVGTRALTLLGGLVRGVGSAASRLNPDLPATLAGSPLEFDSIAGGFEITNGVVTTRDLVYTSRSMTVRARGDYAMASARVNADVTVEHDRGVMQAKVTGPADSPSIRLPSSLARTLDPDRAERGFKDLLKKFR